MSYNHHNRNQGYVPSYTSQNTGAAYMERRGWNNGESEQSTISFSSKRSSKRFYIGLFVLLALLLIAAIVIIILFASGVFTRSDSISPNLNPEQLIHFSTFPSLITTSASSIFSQNVSFSCAFSILRQASEVFDTKNTNTYYSAFNLIQNSLDNVMVSSSLQAYGAKATVIDLQNRGNDLNVLFRISLIFSNGIDQNTISNVLRSNIDRIQGQLGGNAQIDPNTIFVFRILNFK